MCEHKDRSGIEKIELVFDDLDLLDCWIDNEFMMIDYLLVEKKIGLDFECNIRYYLQLGFRIEMCNNT